jgi:hypothetical protein
MHNSSFCDLVIRDIVLSGFAPLFQFQIAGSTVLWFYPETVAKRRLALKT